MAASPKDTEQADALHATASPTKVHEQLSTGLTVFDDHDVDFLRLNQTVVRFASVIDDRLLPKLQSHKKAPVGAKVSKENVDFLLKETALTKHAAEALLHLHKDNLKAAVHAYMATPFDRLFS